MNLPRSQVTTGPPDTPMPSGYSAEPLPDDTSIPDTSHHASASYLAHGPRDSEPSTNSPKSHPWPSLPRHWAIRLPPSNATPPSRPPHTPNTSLQQKLSGKIPKNPITLGHVGELFPVHVGHFQVVIDSPNFTGNAPERFMCQVAQVNNQHRIAGF